MAEPAEKTPTPKSAAMQPSEPNASEHATTKAPTGTKSAADPDPEAVLHHDNVYIRCASF